MEVQVGRSVEARNPPTWARESPIKYEDREDWTVVDQLLVRVICVTTLISPTKEVEFAQLVRRLRETSLIDEEYIKQAIPRIIRTGVSPQGMVRGLVLK